MVDALSKQQQDCPVHLKKGVEIDNSYIQPNYGYGFQYASVPGCPKAISGRPWLYYGSPTRCYLAGIQGPCSSHQTLQWRRGSSFGVCQNRRM
ncbi:hypothetical protein Ocin01_00995 [Orchesella cincta]|uniref:Uncharacterized protein n=1 Tax=Orchesella cincta TaxID=48709 RepID=A0A1D2NK88_ORCCI|nr:hypothetical protein Ocin01_00995 [Orchesella cincta]